MPADARLYQPTKTAMQSGRGKVSGWTLEIEPAGGVVNDDLMGWSGSRDTRKQIKLSFPSQKAALAYAEKNGLTVAILPSQERKIVPKSYADNYAFRKVS